MNPFDPFNVMALRGQGHMRNITLALPTALVSDLLPMGLALGAQTMTPPGTHPVILGFHDMFKLHTTIPTLLPSLTYHEHSVGIPFCYVTLGSIGPTSPGPYYFMPTLLLDSALATLGGIVFWGYPKRLARVTVTGNKYAVAQSNGDPLVDVTWDITGPFLPAASYPNFAPQQAALSQPLLGLVPLSLGPFFVVADFPKDWTVATVRPLETVTEVYTDYVVGFGLARYPKSGKSKGIDASVVGSYELHAPWSMSAPYPPLP
jgi:hypothetical protein